MEFVFLFFVVYEVLVYKKGKVWCGLILREGILMYVVLWFVLVFYIENI